MKNKITLLLCACLLLTMCACGTAKPAPVEPSAPTEAPAPVEPTPDSNPAHTVSDSDLVPEKAPEAPAPASPTAKPSEHPEYPMIVPIGETAFADLDGDGAEEEICVSVERAADGMDRVKLTLNGVDFTDSIYVDGETWFECPDSSYWAITDVYSVDHLLEIAIQDWGPSDDCGTNFFRFEQGEIYPFGYVEGLIWRSWDNSSELSFDEDGFVGAHMRLRVLQTWYADVRYEIAPRGVLDVVPQDLYYTAHPTAVTLKTDLTAYDGKDGDRFPIAAGTEMEVLATDNEEWIVCSSDAEDWQLWFHLNPESAFEIESPDGYIPVSEALTGLCFAD